MKDVLSTKLASLRNRSFPLISIRTQLHAMKIIFSQEELTAESVVEENQLFESGKLPDLRWDTTFRRTITKPSARTGTSQEDKKREISSIATVLIVEATQVTYS